MEMSLFDLPLNCKGRITKLNCSGATKRRLLDLGLINGTSITPILISPSGDPVAYEVRSSVIALRKEVSECINVSK